MADPRWDHFNTQGLPCSCGMTHVGTFPLDMVVPLGWQGQLDYEPDAALRMDGDFLSRNFCVIEGKYFALRMRLPVPYADNREQALLFTAWASVNREDFEAFVHALRTGTIEQGKKAPARLINRIGSYPDTYGLMGIAAQQQDGPPYFIAHADQPPPAPFNPLGVDQRQGASFDKFLEIYAAQGHDMRSAN